jgi:light-regulated signal transduction histidine kinase (bacteriophytochrome)
MSATPGAERAAGSGDDATVGSPPEGATVEDLRREYAELQTRFAERTAELMRVNDELRREIEARTRFERTLERRTRDLARSNQDLEQFAALVSHDLQEPLRTISAYGERLDRKCRGQIDADTDAALDDVRQAAAWMTALIHGLLEYSRLGRGDLHVEPVPFEDVLSRAIGNLRGAIERSNAQITHDPLPEVLGETRQLVQLVQNLVANAIKFRGAQPPRIHVGAESGVDEHHLWVRDEGIGMDPRQHERVFVVFQRLHTREEYPGIGIGLALCKRIVERHGGRLWVESRLGAGSTFHFALPVAGPPRA